MTESGSVSAVGGIEDAMPRAQWWAAVLAGLASGVVATPVVRLLPPTWVLPVLVVLPLVAVVAGFTPTFRRALGTRGSGASGAAAPGVVPGPAPVPGATAAPLLLAGVCLFGLVGGTAALVVLGQGSLLTATGLAVAAHLLCTRVERGLLRPLPGVGGPVPPVPADGRPDPRGWAERGARWVPVTAVGLAAALVLLHLGSLATLDTGVRSAMAVLLAASPAAFALAREIPGRAARDRGRELGIVYGGIDLRRLSRVRSVVLPPEAVCDPQPRLVGIHPAGRLQVTAALQAAASVAASSAHPSHRALLRAARERGLVLRPTEDVPELGTPPEPPAGLPPTVHARVKDTVVTLGRAEDFPRVPPGLAGHQMYVGWGGAARAGFDLAPSIRSQGLSDRSELTALDLDPVLVGHDPVALRDVGDALEIPLRDRRDLGAEAPGDILDEYAEEHAVLLLDTPATRSLVDSLVDTPAPRVGRWTLAADARPHSAATARTATATTPPAPTAVDGDSTPGTGAPEPTTPESRRTTSRPVVFRAVAGLPEASDPLVTAPASASVSVAAPEDRILRTEKGDLTSALRAVGLARKAARVSSQSILLAGLVQVLALVGAALGLLGPEVTAVLGAVLPLLVTINAVRPRSFARSTDPATESRSESAATSS